MAHEGPEHRIVQMVLQDPEYHYILDVWEVRITAMIHIETITMIVMMIRITVVMITTMTMKNLIIAS